MCVCRIGEEFGLKSIKLILNGKILISGEFSYKLFVSVAIVIIIMVISDVIVIIIIIHVISDSVYSVNNFKVLQNITFAVMCTLKKIKIKSKVQFLYDHFIYSRGSNPNIYDIVIL